jgi:hypothetical protein
MVWSDPSTWENPFKGWWGAPAETEPAVAEMPDSTDLAAPPAETEGETQGETPATTGGRRKKHRKTKRSKKSKSKKTGRRKH